jgi:hypothetical protein
MIDVHDGLDDCVIHNYLSHMVSVVTMMTLTTLIPWRQ